MSPFILESQKVKTTLSHNPQLIFISDIIHDDFFRQQNCSRRSSSVMIVQHPISLIGFCSTAAFGTTAFPLSRIIVAPKYFPLRLVPTQRNMSSTLSDDAVNIAANISLVRRMMDDAIASSERKSGRVRLVAVSKTKPLELLQAAYEVRLSHHDISTTILVKICLFTHFIAKKGWPTSLWRKLCSGIDDKIFRNAR